MKFQCGGCKRIHATRLLAGDCCKPTVFPLADDLVAPCSERGLDCDDEMCVFCQGTGLMEKPVEST